MRITKYCMIQIWKIINISSFFFNKYKYEAPEKRGALRIPSHLPIFLNAPFLN